MIPTAYNAHSASDMLNAQHLHIAEADGVISYSVDLDRVEVVRLYGSLMDTAMYKSSIQTNVVARPKV